MTATAPGPATSPVRPSRRSAHVSWGVLLGVAGLVVLLVAYAASYSRAAAGSPSAAGTPVAPVDPGVCDLPTADDAVPTAAPQGARWTRTGVMQVPSLPATHGPAVVRGGVRQCYSHTPTAAVLAVVSPVGETSDPVLRPGAVLRATADGTGHDRAVAALEEAGTPQVAPDPGVRRQDGDWKVVVPDDGNLTAGSDVLYSLLGHVPWSAG